MRVEPYLLDEIKVLESRLADRTLPVAEHDRLRGRLQDIRRQLSGVPSPEDMAELLRRIESLEEGQGKLHELIAYLEARLTASGVGSTAPESPTCVKQTTISCDSLNTPGLAKALADAMRDNLAAAKAAPETVTADAGNQLKGMQMLPPDAVVKPDVATEQAVSTIGEDIAPKPAKRGRPKKLPQFPGPTPETTAMPEISDSFDEFLGD